MADVCVRLHTSVRLATGFRSAQEGREISAHMNILSDTARCSNLLSNAAEMRRVLAQPSQTTTLANLTFKRLSSAATSAGVDKKGRSNALVAVHK